jgi:hypothetical protein
LAWGEAREAGVSGQWESGEMALYLLSLHLFPQPWAHTSFFSHCCPVLSHLQGQVLLGAILGPTEVIPMITISE